MTPTFDDIQKDKSRKHKWARIPVGRCDKCLKCGRTAYSILSDITELIPEIEHRMTTGVLDTFWPCISDDEALIKDILE